jgi:hemerythrin
MNSKIQWTSNLQVGSDDLDIQHKVLFDLIRDINNAIRTGASLRVLDTLLGVVLNYTLQHFVAEEEYFKNHVDYTDHCLEHYRLIKKLHKFIINFRNNKRDSDRTPSDFLEKWLVEHIEHYDKPFLAQTDIRLKLMTDFDTIDEYESDHIDRRHYKRISPEDVVDGEISVYCYNATRLKGGLANIVDMSPGGLMLDSPGRHEIDDLLVISCRIGANFKMKEKVRVKTVKSTMYGVEFVFPTSETIEFFTELYGSVRLRRNA